MAMDEALLKTPKYPPLEGGEALDKRPKWYRSALASERQEELLKKDNTKACIQVLGFSSIYFCTGTLVILFSLYEHTFLWLLTLWIHGTVGSCFLFGTHELNHGTVFEDDRVNQVFLHIFSLLSWWDPYEYKLSHKFHHSHTQHANYDRENLFPLDPTVTIPAVVQLLTVSLWAWPGRVFGKGGFCQHVYLFWRAAAGYAPGMPGTESFEWLEAIRKYDLDKQSGEQYKKIRQWSIVMLVFHGSVLLFSVYKWLNGSWGGLQAILVVVTISLGTFIANWLRFIMGFTQHCGLRSDFPDFRKNTRSVKMTWPLEFLYWHMNWHIEHHMFPRVPCYNLKALHQEVEADMPKPRTLVGAWKEMWRIALDQAVDPNYEFDTRLPETAWTYEAWVKKQQLEKKRDAIAEPLLNQAAVEAINKEIDDLKPKTTVKKPAEEKPDTGSTASVAVW